MRKSRADLWQELKEFDTCMLVTRAASKLRSRPMRPYPDAARRVIRFLTSSGARKVGEIAACPEANVVFSSAGEGLWISVSGKAEISNDGAAVDALWSAETETWFNGGREDAVVLTVRAESAEYWDHAENRLHATWEMLESIADGKKPEPAENSRLIL